MMPFAAVLLAGGQSRRMGRDKALLPLPDGRLLWQRQLKVLQDLRPAELFISGPAREGFPPDVPLLADEMPGLGPLAGITKALRVMHSPLLVVLAIDLPAMTAAFLCELLDLAGSQGQARGVVPQTTAAYHEPLAAVYPRSAADSAQEHLRGANRSLQSFVRLLVLNGQAIAKPIGQGDAALFANWNRPDDLLTAAAEWP